MKVPQVASLLGCLLISTFGQQDSRCQGHKYTGFHGSFSYQAISFGFSTPTVGLRQPEEKFSLPVTLAEIRLAMWNAYKLRAVAIVATDSSRCGWLSST